LSTTPPLVWARTSRYVATNDEYEATTGGSAVDKAEYEATTCRFLVDKDE
jgi:hypothetical protein